MVLKGDNRPYCKVSRFSAAKELPTNQFKAQQLKHFKKKRRGCGNSLLLMLHLLDSAFWFMYGGQRVWVWHSKNSNLAVSCES